ncbi:hypothetical protein CR513_48099, partial [Mucuna pruriens]
MEFLELKQGNMFVVNYSAMFEELLRIYDEDNKARVAYYKNVDFARDKRIKGQSRLKPYSAPPFG